MSDSAYDLVRLKLERLAAMPKPFVCVVRYADNSERRIGCISALAAENCRERESANIGRDLISCETGKTVRKISVTVESA